jgi:penicillin-binding protein 1A
VNLAEAAMLAGLFKAPTNYAPHVDLAAARGRANLVLSNLVDAGFMTEGQVSAARRNPATPIDHAATMNSPDYFLDYAFEELRPMLADVRSSSYTVRTTIDPVLQSYAEDAIVSVLREQGEQYDVSQGAMIVTEPNGAIRAMVGGTDYGKSQFNRAVASLRQPGSSFKPFVYAEAIETMDLKPDSVVSGATRCIGDWCPRNYSGNSVGRISLISAFAQSINTVPVNLSIQMGRQPIADLAHRMGVKTDFEVTRSLALGAASLTVLDMVNGYNVFANGGLATPSFGITRITTARGDVVWEQDPTPQRERVLKEQTVEYMNQLMRAVVTNGTGRRAQIEGVPAVGKTGTTSDYRDAWFCGFTGNYVAAVWLGNDDYHKTKTLTGGLLPAVAWQKFMTYAHTNIQVKPLLGVDFEPKPFVVAEAGDGTALPQAERPPTLKPEAAIKLLDLADSFESALKSTQSGAEVAALAVTAAPAGSL